jgi:hypothetical protein
MKISGIMSEFKTNMDKYSFNINIEDIFNIEEKK